MQYSPYLNYAERLYYRFIKKFPRYFEGRSVGCRDKRTMKFFQTCGVDAYFSRCLTLTLPKILHSTSALKHKKVLVAVREHMKPHLPPSLLKDAEFFSPDVNIHHLLWNGLIDIQKSVALIDDARAALHLYAGSSLVVTDRVHIAAPCLAMGIPVVILKLTDNDPRYDMFDGIAHVYTFEELKTGRVDFDPDVVDITALQKLMLHHFNLTLKALTEPVQYQSEIKELRQEIFNYHS